MATLDLAGIITRACADLRSKFAALSHTHNASDITDGTLTVGRIPFLSTSHITSGTFNTARIPSLAASKITSGTFDPARIPTATTSTLGGVIVGSGLSITDGLLRADFTGPSIDTDGNWKIYKIGSIKICTRTITGSLAVTTSYGGRYISTLQTATFPTGILNEVVYADVVAASSPGIYWTAKTAISGTSMSYYVVANTSLTQNVTRKIIVIGAY